MIVFDVMVNDRKVDTLRPKTSRLKELRLYIDQQFEKLVEQHGQNVYLSRRFEY